MKTKKKPDLQPESRMLTAAENDNLRAWAINEPLRHYPNTSMVIHEEYLRLVEPEFRKLFVPYPKAGLVFLTNERSLQAEKENL